MSNTKETERKIKIRFNGVQVSTLEEAMITGAVEPEAAVYELNTSRSGLAKPVELDLKEKDVVELTLNTGVAWHYRADDFEEFLQSQPGTRGGTDGVLEILSFLGQSLAVIYAFHS